MRDFDVDRSQLVASLSVMIRTPSVNTFGVEAETGAEAAMADLFEVQLRALGLEIGSHDVLKGRRNVWGRLKGAGDGPTILLAGHLDTVGVDGYVDPFEPHVKGDNIFGRGACDMKAGLAAYLEVIRILQRSDVVLRGDVIVAGVIDEEHAMAGSTYFGRHGPKADFAIVAEPTQLEICPAHKGQVLMTLRTTGLAAHSSLPQNGRNAIYHMGAVLGALQDYAAELRGRPDDPMCGAPSFSVGVIRGGDNACSVPDFCEIDIDRRTIPGETSDAVLAEIRAVIAGVKKTMPELDCSLQIPFLDLTPLDTPQASPVMKAMSKACAQVIGASTVTAFPGSTDAPNFGCPTVICGAGHLAQCHSLNEYVSLAQIEDAVRIYTHAILELQSH